MKLIDLSIELSNNMPTHHNFPKPVILPYMTHEESAKNLTGGRSIATTFVAMLDHCGTHVDAYFHLKPQGTTVDAMRLEEFYGPAVCWDFTHIPPKGTIDITDIEEAREKSRAPFQEGDIVLMNTGHHKRTWPDKQRWENTYPGLTYEATKWFFDHEVKIHGIEGPSTDLPESTYPAHRACRDFGITHIECLTNLEEVVNQRFTFIGFPLKLVGASGSPLRAVALLD
ncbi:cyclase family protein [Chloroflexota bacterium]